MMGYFQGYPVARPLHLWRTLFLQVALIAFGCINGQFASQEFSSHAPDGRDISRPTAAPGAVSAPDPSSGFAQSAPVNVPAPAPPMLGQEGVPAIGVTPPVSTPPMHSGAGGAGAGGHETLHTEFGTIKVAKPALAAAHHAAKLVEE